MVYSINIEVAIDMISVAEGIKPLSLIPYKRIILFGKQLYDIINDIIKIKQEYKLNINYYGPINVIWCVAKRHPIVIPVIVVYKRKKDLEELLSLYKEVNFQNLSMQDVYSLVRETGRLLGYPDCCIEAFVKAIREGNGGLHEGLIATEVCLEGNKIMLIVPSFYPCSPNCPNALKFCKKVYDAVIKYIDKKIIEEYLTRECIEHVTETIAIIKLETLLQKILQQLL